MQKRSERNEFFLKNCLFWNCLTVNSLKNQIGHRSPKIKVTRRRDQAIGYCSKPFVYLIFLKSWLRLWGEGAPSLPLAVVVILLIGRLHHSQLFGHLCSVIKDRDFMAVVVSSVEQCCPDPDPECIRIPGSELWTKFKIKYRYLCYWYRYPVHKQAQLTFDEYR